MQDTFMKHANREREPKFRNRTTTEEHLFSLIERVNPSSPFEPQKGVNDVTLPSAFLSVKISDNKWFNGVS